MEMPLAAAIRMPIIGHDSIWRVTCYLLKDLDNTSHGHTANCM